MYTSDTESSTGGVSSVVTMMPASVAFFITGSSAFGSDGARAMPVTPCAMYVSIVSICLATSSWGGTKKMAWSALSPRSAPAAITPFSTLLQYGCTDFPMTTTRNSSASGGGGDVGSGGDVGAGGASVVAGPAQDATKTTITVAKSNQLSRFMSLLLA